MPRVSETFHSKSLCAADLDDADFPATILRVEEKHFDDGTKYIVELKECDKAFVCNKTNAITIAKMYGDDTDDWLGKRITLFVTDVQSKNGMVPAIRVRSRPPKPPVRPPAPAMRPVGRAAPPVTQAEADMPDDEWDQDRE